MHLLSQSAARHWAALVALGLTLAVTAAFAQWDSGYVSVASSSPAEGKVREADLDVGPDGTSYAAWTREVGGTSRLEVAVGRGGELRAPTPVPIETRAPGGVFYPEVAAGPDSALVAFRAGDQANLAVMALRLSREGGVEGPFVLSGGSDAGSYLDVGVADDGRGVVAWTDYASGGDPDGGPRWDLRAAAVGEAGGGEQVLATQLVTQTFSLAVAPDGRAAIASVLPGREVTIGQRTGGRIFVNEAPPGGTFGSPIDAPGPMGDAAVGESAAVGYSRDGALRAAWVESDGAGVSGEWTVVTALRRGLVFEDRVELARDPLAQPLSVVPVRGGELVAWQPAGPSGTIPEDEVRLDVAAVARQRVLRRASLVTRERYSDGGSALPWLEPDGAGALAVWPGPETIGYARCSVERGCDERNDVTSAGRGEELDVAGIGEGVLAWLESRDPAASELRVGELPKGR